MEKIDFMWYLKVSILSSRGKSESVKAELLNAQGIVFVSILSSRGKSERVVKESIKGLVVVLSQSSQVEASLKVWQVKKKRR